jgi:hypothetical protein
MTSNRHHQNDVNVNRNVNVDRTVNRSVGVVRGWSARPYFGTLVRGVVLGSIVTAAAVGVAPAPPNPSVCWFWTDDTRTQGYWTYRQGQKTGSPPFRTSPQSVNLCSAERHHVVVGATGICCARRPVRSARRSYAAAISKSCRRAQRQASYAAPHAVFCDRRKPPGCGSAARVFSPRGSYFFSASA